MGAGLRCLKAVDVEAACFVPLGKRESVGFEGADKWHLQIFHADSVKDWALAEPHAAGCSALSHAYLDRFAVIEGEREPTMEHVARRVQLFFQQAILCYKTPFVFEADGAEDQIGKGTSVKFCHHITHKTQAAHSSTLPCLIAIPKDDAGALVPERKFVFLKYSHAYALHNSTYELPIEVNQTDTYLDGKTTEAKLRTAALALLNRVAAGELNPQQATSEFLEKFQERLNESIDHLAVDDPRRLVAQIYLEQVETIIEDAEAGDDYFDAILGVQLPGATDVLRRVVFERRYRVIQEAEFIESQIARAIFNLQRTLTRRAPRHLKKVDYRLRYALLNGAGNERERRFYEKLFCCSSQQLLAGVADDATKRAKLIKTFESFEVKHADGIAKLRRDIRTLRRRMQRLEFQFRADLFRGLRVEYRHLTQRAFADAFKQHHPDEPMSQAMVSRLEQPARLPTPRVYLSPVNQRRKEMTFEKARLIAQEFGVEAGLFQPCLVASDG